MAFLGEDGDLSGVTGEDVERANRGGRKMIEAGWYRCMLVEDEAKPYRWGTGLSMQFQIIDGEYENQRVFDFLCVRHADSAQAEQIARAKLKAFAIAAGAKNPDDVSDTAILYNKPVMIEVFRDKQKDPKYADEDGCKAKPGQFMSVTAWKAEQAGEPTPKAAKPKSAPKANMRSEIPADDDEPLF